MFSDKFQIEYNHFDAQNLDLKNQVKINATCQDLGVQFLKQKDKHNIIVKQDLDFEDVMSIQVLFGN